MRPPIYKRLSREDFQDAPNWIDRLLLPLNQFMESTTNIFSKNISLGDNIQARSFTLSLTTTASYTTGTFEPVKFSWGGASLPTFVQVTSITKDDGTPFLGSVGTPAWRYVDGVVISYVPGLADSSKYSVTFLVF